MSKTVVTRIAKSNLRLFKIVTKENFKETTKRKFLRNNKNQKNFIKMQRMRSGKNNRTRLSINSKRKKQHK